MKSFNNFLVILITLISIESLAQDTPPNVSDSRVRIETELSVHADVEYKRRTKYFHNLNCPKRETRTRGDGRRRVSGSNKNTYQGEADIILALKDYQRGHTRRPRKFTIKVESQMNEDGSASLVAGVTDNIDWKEEN